MGRKPRVEFVGAFYHVICRGNQRQMTGRSDADRNYYLKRVGAVSSARSILLPLVAPTNGTAEKELVQADGFARGNSRRVKLCTSNWKT
jgi:hypothetical protein